MASLLTIFIASILTHNIAFMYILGICPIVALGRNVKTASGMGIAVILVVTMTAIINWLIRRFVLMPCHAEIITYIVFIVVIAASVQLTEMIMERFFPPLQAAFGLFLPLITVNCIVLAVSLFMTSRDYSFLKTVSFALGTSVGYYIAIVLSAAMYEKLEAVGDVPRGLKGPGIILVIIGVLSLAFMAFGGMLPIE